MPHIIVEYTNSDKHNINVMTLMKDVHDAALATELFNEKALKVRTKAYDAALVAGKRADFAHITIYLIEGRDEATKKRLTERVHEVLVVHFKSYDSLSVDARETSLAVYTKTTKN